MTRQSFTRTEERFYSLFAAVVENLATAATQLAAMLRDVDDLPAQAAHVKDYEHTGDALTRQLFTLLHQTTFPPLEPAAIQRLTSALDDVMDALNATAEKLVIYRVDQRRPEAAEIGDLLVQAGQELVAAMLLLRRRTDRPQLRRHIDDFQQTGPRLDAPSMFTLWKDRYNEHTPLVQHHSYGTCTTRRRNP